MEAINIVSFDSLDSTSVKAKELAKKDYKPWTVVVAKSQAKGYGRKGNAWYSPEGGLYFSVILPRVSVTDLQIITILTAFSVANVIKENFGIEPFVKLPNDVYLNGKKVCGMLTENIILKGVTSSVIGIGLNTNVDEFSESGANATSLKIETKKEINNSELMEKIVKEIQKTFSLISKKE